MIQPLPKSLSGPLFEPEPGWGHAVKHWMRTYLLGAIVPMAIIILNAILLVLYYKHVGPFSGSAAQPSPSTVVTTAGQTLTESVRKGDSYTTVARRIINNMLLIEQTGTTTLGARLYAETKLAQEFKNQLLTVGSTISYVSPHVLDILSSYRNLSSTQKAKWETMAKNVKFE